MEEISAVTHVPMFWPMMIGRAALYFTAPVMQSACKIPTEADEDWMIAVSTAPAITPRIGLVNINRMFVNSGTSASGLTAPLIISMPVISTAKPIMMLPASCFLSPLAKSSRQTPINARTGVNVAGLHNVSSRLSPCKPVSERIQLVTVVPMFAPMMTPAACESRMMPELTKPTTITVVADEDWIIAVTPAPSSTALILLLVRLSRMLSSLPPEARVNPSPITCMPYKNSARPQSKLSAFVIPIRFLSSYHSFVVIPILTIHCKTANNTV